MAPAVKRVLPPASSSGARSSTATRAPCSCADSAAQNAALPPPTTTTSNSSPPPFAPSGIRVLPGDPFGTDVGQASAPRNPDRKTAGGLLRRPSRRAAPPSVQTFGSRGLVPVVLVPRLRSAARSAAVPGGLRGVP